MSHLIIKKMFILDIKWNFSFYKIYHRKNSDVLKITDEFKEFVLL